MSDKKNIASVYLGQLLNGKWNEISPVFGNNLDIFLRYLQRYGLLDDIDIELIYMIDDFLVNPIMKSMLTINPSYLNEIVENFFIDVEIKSDGYYLKLDNLSELSSLFDSSWKNDYQSYVESAFSDEYWDVYENESNNFYKDIIMNLNYDNLNYLAEKIIDKLGNQELSLDDVYSPLFEEISNNGLFIITESNIMDIIYDQESIESLFKNKLYDLKRSFLNLYDVAYNEAYKDELRDEILKEVSIYLDTKNISNENDEIILIKIKDLYSDVMRFLNFFISRPSNLIDYNSYLHMMDLYLRRSLKPLQLYVDVEPDDQVLVDNINDEFLNYLNY